MLISPGRVYKHLEIPRAGSELLYSILKTFPSEPRSAIAHFGFTALEDLKMMESEYISKCRSLGVIPYSKALLQIHESPEKEVSTFLRPEFREYYFEDLARGGKIGNIVVSMFERGFPAFQKTADQIVGQNYEILRGEIERSDFRVIFNYKDRVSLSTLNEGVENWFRNLKS